MPFEMTIAEATEKPIRNLPPDTVILVEPLGSNTEAQIRQWSAAGELVLQVRPESVLIREAVAVAEWKPK